MAPLVLVLALSAAACGTDEPASPPEPIDPATSVDPADRGDPATSVDPGEPTTPSEPADRGEAVAEVRLRGALASVGDGPLRLCGDASAGGCGRSIELDGLTWADVPVSPRSVAWGRWHPDRFEIDGAMLADGRVAVASLRAEAVVQLDALPCPAQTADYPWAGADAYERGRRAIVDYTATIPLVLAGGPHFDTRRGLMIIQVTDDPAPHQAALDEVAPRQACVVQVTNNRFEIRAVRDRLRDLRTEWIDRGYGVPDVATPIESNSVAVDVDRIDGRYWDDLGGDGERVWTRARIEVLGDDQVDVLDRVVREPLALDEGRLYVGCRGLPVDPAVFETVPDSHVDGHPTNALFRQTSTPGVPAADDPEGWWRVFADDDRVLYVSESMGALVGVGAGESWAWAGSGACDLGVLDPLGMTVQSWSPARDAEPGRELAVVVTVGACPGVVDGDLSALVDESAAAVTVTILRRPADEQRRVGCLDSDGPGSVEVPFVVVLDAPLGDRELADGGPYPAVAVS